VKPHHYLEYRVVGMSRGPDSSVLVPVMTRLFATLHAVKRTHQLDIALAFPGMYEGEGRDPARLGELIRVWASDETTLNTLSTHAALPAGIVPFVGIGDVETFDTSQECRWRAYARYRIPSRRSRVEGARSSRLERSERLPFFRVGSRSNRQAFSISILPIEVKASSAAAEADSYGLSRLSEPLGLPEPETCG